MKAEIKWLGGLFFRAALGVTFLMAAGCTTAVRGRTNHGLWQTRLPSQPNYNGVVFILNSPPRPEFAFLLAEKYPESFVLIIPSSSWTGKYKVTQISKRGLSDTHMYMRDETSIRGQKLLIQPGDIVFRNGIENRELLITSNSLGRILDKYIIFHRMKAISCSQVSDLWASQPSITLSWSRREYNQLATAGTWERWIPIWLPESIFGGLLPPCSSSFMGNPSDPELLEVDILGHGKRKFAAREQAYKGYQMGDIWALLLIPFCFGDIVNFYRSGGDFSPGGWADCLEQMFQHPEIQSVATSIDSQCRATRNSCFQQMYSAEGYDLQPPPFWEYFRGGPLFQFGSPWRGVCLFKDPQHPEGTLFLWSDFTGDKNMLEPIWAPDDFIKSKNKFLRLLPVNYE